MDDLYVTFERFINAPTMDNIYQRLNKNITLISY